MATVSDIEIRFSLCRDDGETDNRSETFNATDSSLQDDVDGFFEELVEEFNDDNADQEHEWGKNGYKVECYDGDFADPADFDNLNDYGDYAVLVEKFGEAFHLRYEDTGEDSPHRFEDLYQGCFESVEAYAQHVVEEQYDIDVPSFVHIDWDRTAWDLLIGASSYEGDDGVHIFSE